VSPLIAYENDVAPRKVRIVGIAYEDSYVAELDLDPAETLRIVGLGDADLPFGDTPAAIGAVEATVGAIAPASSYAVAQALAPRVVGAVGVISFDGNTDSSPDYGDQPNSSHWVRAAYLSIPQPSPTNHVQIGMRGMNNPRNMDFYRDRGMRTTREPEARELGSKRLAAEAVATASAGIERSWIAVDLDVLDSAQTPEWDWPDPYGVLASDILETAFAVGRSGKLSGVSLMMVAGSVRSVQRFAVWTVMYALVGVAAAR
jgi:arginase family enzyme